MIELKLIADVRILDMAARGGDVARKDLLNYRYGYSTSGASHRLQSLVKKGFLDKLGTYGKHVIYLITNPGYQYWLDNKKYLD